MNKIQDIAALCTVALLIIIAFIFGVREPDIRTAVKIAKEVTCECPDQGVDAGGLICE